MSANATTSAAQAPAAPNASEYVSLTVQVREQLSVPCGTVLLTSECTGEPIGLRLPSGEVITPWITYELARDVHGREADRDLTFDELGERDVMQDLGIMREIDSADPDVELPAEEVTP